MRVLRHPESMSGARGAISGLGWPAAAGLLVVLGACSAYFVAARPIVAAGAVASLLLAAQAARRPLHGLYLIFAVVALLGSESLLGLHLGIRWVEVDLLLVVCTLGWLVRLLARGDHGRLSRLDLTMLLVATAMAIGAFRGLSHGVTLEDLRSELRPPGYLLLTYAVARHSLGERSEAAKAFTVLLVLSLLVAVKSAAVYGYAPLAPGGEPERILWATRVMNSGGFKRVVAQGAEIFPLLGLLLLLPRVLRLHSLGARLGGWAGCSLLFLAVAVSLTRSYWLGLAVGLAWLSFLGPWRVSLRLLAGIAGTALLLVAGGFALETAVPSVAAGDLLHAAAHRLHVFGPSGWDPSSRERLFELEAIRELILDSPWFGSGLGARYSFHSSMARGIWEWEYTHNSYAYWLMKLGFIGSLPVFLALGLGVAAGLRWVRKATDATTRALACGVSACLTALLVVSATAPWMTHYVGAAWTGLLLGVCESQRLAPAPTVRTSPPWAAPEQEPR